MVAVTTGTVAGGVPAGMGLTYLWERHFSGAVSPLAAPVGVVQAGVVRAGAAAGMAAAGAVVAIGTGKRPNLSPGIAVLISAAHPVSG